MYKYMETLIEPLSEQTKIQIQNQKEPKRKKYSILEVLIVFSAIGVVVTLAFLAINPGKTGAEARNRQRQADVSYILGELSSYSRGREGIPDEIPVTDRCVEFGNEICKIGPYDCEDLVDLSFLNDPNTEDTAKIPNDPLYVSINGTGYYTFQDGKGSITVCAPYAERNENITFTKYLY
jgi:type II secretory pathway pseudopilin PulG